MVLKMNKKAILGFSLTWLIIIAILLLFGISYFYKQQTFNSIKTELKNEEWQGLTKEEHIEMCYDLITNHFGTEEKCWKKYPLRNFYSQNLWELKGECLPCIIQNQLFQECLKDRFEEKDIHTKKTSCFTKGVYFHYHTQINVNGDWLDVDVYGKKFGGSMCD